MENKSDVNQAEEKPQKCVFIGKNIILNKENMQ